MTLLFPSLPVTAAVPEGEAKVAWNEKSIEVLQLVTLAVVQVSKAARIEANSPIRVASGWRSPQAARLGIFTTLPAARPST